MNQYVKKTGKLLLNILLYAFIAVCLFAVILSITSKKGEDGAATVFGYQMRFVRSDSMAACKETDVSHFEIGSIPSKTLIFVETVPNDKAEAEKWYSEIKVGDVLTFRYKLAGSQETITHRVIGIEEKEDGFGRIITLQGDNKASEGSDLMQQVIDTSESETSFNYILGKVTGTSYTLGLLVYALRSPVGIVCIVIVPCLIIIGFQVAKIISVLTEEKRKKQKEENEQKTSEIEELKKQLALLQQSVNADMGGADDESGLQKRIPETSEENVS